MGGIISFIAPQLWSPLVQGMQDLGKVDDNIEALNEALNELKLAKAEVDEKIRAGAARTDKHGPTDRANKWLDDVRAIDIEVISLVEEKYNKRSTILMQCLGGYRCPLNCWSSYNISKQATNLTIKVLDLIKYKQEKMNVVTQKLVPAAWKEMPATVPETTSSSSSATTTVQYYLNKACDYIKDVGVGMVGIYGMGGVGKTTLLKSVNNHLPAAVGAYRFDHVIWVVASQDLNINNLQKLIAEKVSFHLDFDSTTVEERGESLCDFLKGKKILLFLDDIWQPIGLEKLGVRFPTNNNDNKVVFTTRSEKVCNEMIAYHSGVRGQKIKVDCLKQDEAWELFLNNVGATAKRCIDSNEKVGDFAMRVAKKCGGLPLALIVIARAMSSNETRTEWEVALDSLSAFDIEELWRNGSDLFPLLKKSYDSLPNETMRECFLFCSLWPEDANILEGDLILLWLGLNLIDGSNSFRSGYNKGVTIIQGLKRAGLLEEVENRFHPAVKMHDIIRGMALWITSDCRTNNKNKWIVHSGEQEEDVTNTNWEEAEVISLKGSKLKNVTKEYCPSFPNLSALFLDKCKVGKEVADVLFQNMLALKYLSLKNCHINPSSIVRLDGLCSLTLINVGLTAMFHQQVVPIELSNLTELKYLWLEGNIRSIHHGLISKLKKLEFLRIAGYKRWGGKGEASVEELGYCYGLKTVGIDIYRKSMVEQLMCAMNRRQVVSLWHISITDLQGVSSLSLLEFIGEEERGGALKANLQQLIIINCFDLEEIVVVRVQKEKEKEKEEFTNLQSLFLYNLGRLEKIAWEVNPGVVFRNVTVLQIERCSQLKSVTWIGQLLYLERLIINDCNNLVQVIGDTSVEDHEGSSASTSGDQIIVVDDEIQKEQKEEEKTLQMPLPPITPIIFSHLKYLSLCRLPNLTSFSSQKIDLRSLKFLEIQRCPRLDLSPFSNHTIHS